MWEPCTIPQTRTRCTLTQRKSRAPPHHVIQSRDNALSVTPLDQDPSPLFSSRLGRDPLPSQAGTPGQGLWGAHDDEWWRRVHEAVPAYSRARPKNKATYQRRGRAATWSQLSLVGTLYNNNFCVTYSGHSAGWKTERVFKAKGQWCCQQLPPSLGSSRDWP